jgi:benzil reductase ((S)-benzoin forming)
MHPDRAAMTKPITRAIVTGHTRGLGAALAQQLLQRDIAVLGLGRSRNQTLAAQFAGSLKEVELDLAALDQLSHWVAGDTLRHFIDGADCVLLFNNAGTVQPVGSLETHDANAIALAVSLNVAAPLMLASAVARASIGVRDRRIVHLSSGAARNAYAGWSAYCATKAALDHHARSVALDGNPALRICSLAPGVVNTDMQGEIRSSSTEQFPMRDRFEKLKAEGQLVSPLACAARLVDFALSDAFGEQPVADIRELALPH